MKNHRTIWALYIILLVLLIFPCVYSQEDDSTFRFAVITDSMQEELNTKGQNSPKVLEITDVIINDVKPSFVINIGDMIGGHGKTDDKPASTDIELKNGMDALFKLAQKYKDNNIPFLPIAGNHDVTPKAEVFRKSISNYNLEIPTKAKDTYKRYYSFTHKNTYFILLYVPSIYSLTDKGDSEAAKQFNWLKDQIEDAKSGNYEHIFVFGHIPVESISYRGANCMTPLGRDPLPDAVINLLAQDKIIYFSGHEHVFKEFMTKGVHQVIAGQAGIGGFRCLKGETKKQTNSFVVVDVKGKDVSIYGLPIENDYKKTFSENILPEGPEAVPLESIVEEDIQRTTQEILSQQRGGKDKLIGIYSITPAFRTKIEYNISDYDIIKEAVIDETEGLINKVKDCETGSKGIEECITSSIASINKRKELIDNQLTFFDGPCDTTENIKSDLIEDYFACKDSPDDDCVCTVTLNKDPANDEKAVTITAAELDSEEEPDYENDALKRAFMGVQRKTITGIDSTGMTTDEPFQITMAEGDSSKNALFYKDAENMYYIKDGKSGSKKSCRTNRRTYKFCVRDSKKQSWIYNALTGKTEQQYINYKFALTFRDSSPPAPVKSLGVADLPLSDKKVIVMWEESPEPDIAGYTVMQAEYNKTKDALTNELPFDYVKANPKVEKKALLLRDTEVIEVIEGGMPTVCDYKGLQLQCYLGNELVNISEDKLYKIITEGVPTMFMQVFSTIDDETNYDYSVVAIDTSGNELIILNPILRNETSYDDLPPAVVQGTTAIKLDAVNVSMIWDRPLTNMDGSQITDLEGFHIYNAPSEEVINIETLTPIKTIKVPADHKEGDLEFRYSENVKVQGNGYLAVIAFDTNGNEYKNDAVFVQY